MHLKRYSAVGLVVMLAFASAAMGGVLSNDPNAYNDGTAAWHGTESFDKSLTVGVFTLALEVNVDYAVYAPGYFDASFGTANDPSDGSQYVYAYQILNNQGGNVPLASFSVGFANSQYGATLPQNVSFVLTDSGATPYSSAQITGGNNPQSAFYSFINQNVPAEGGYSDILIFTSPNPPQWETGSITWGSIGQSANLPSPVPEPATGSFALAAAFFLAIRGFCKRRAKN